MNNDIAIDTLLENTWLLVTQLRFGAATSAGAPLYTTCCAEVEKVKRALQAAGIAQASIDHITYAQCALLDEAAMTRGTAEEEATDDWQQWRAAPLQARYFATLQAGETLYDRIAEVLKSPAPSLLVLTCCHRLLTLGFQGAYGVGSLSQGQRDKIVAALTARVAALDSDSDLLIQPPSRQRWPLWHSLRWWTGMALLAGLLVWWLGNRGLDTLLQQTFPGP